MSAKLAGVVFDAYGTLLDVHALQSRLEALFPAKGQAISARWRQKQIDYTWLRTLGGRYADFAVVTGDALDYACEEAGAALQARDRAALLGLYDRLPAFPEVPATLSALSTLGLPLGVLSNGNPHMLETALSAAGIAPHFAHVLSVDRVRKFKTAPEAYRLALDAFGAPAGDLAFVSSNGWDAAGAAWFGFRAFWVNRTGAPTERLGVTPERIARGLNELPGWLGA